MATWEPLVQQTGTKPYAPNYLTSSGSIWGLNSIVYPQLPHITGNTPSPPPERPQPCLGRGSR